MTTEQIFSYKDGSVYMGEMKNGLRHGRGTLRTPAYVYSLQNKHTPALQHEHEYTSENAVENAHLAKWHEYIGYWENDKMHGPGVHLWKSGNGSEVTLFQGEWVHGQPQRPRRISDTNNIIEEELELEIFGY